MKPCARFDPQEQCWHTLGGAALPHPRWGSAVALDAEGRLFVCGGYKDGRPNVRESLVSSIAGAKSVFFQHVAKFGFFRCPEFWGGASC